MSIIEQMQQTYFAADRRQRAKAHWRLNDDAYDRFRYELKDYQHEWTETPTFMGLNVYRGHLELDEPGFLLCDGTPPDPVRESELRRQLAAMHREFQARAKPIVDELVEIENRKPPRPIVIPADALSPDQLRRLTDRIGPLNDLSR